MASLDRLEELKRQVQNTSNQQFEVQKQRKQLENEVANQKQELEEHQEEMQQLLRSVFGQSELAAAKERELLQDKIEIFSHRQSVMNEQLIALNDNLTDTTALKDLYETKRELLELEYQNKKETLDKEMELLMKCQSARKSDLERLESEIKDTEDKLSQIVSETQKASLWHSFKTIWIDKWIMFAIVGFIAMVIGGFCGWGIFTFIENVLSSIGKFLGSFSR